MKPEVSIILATLNEVENVPSMIDAIFEHLGDTAEVIIVDDNSSDGTWQKVEEIGQLNPRVRLVRRQKARGLASATLRGIIEADGQLIGWMDADAYMLPHRLPEMVSLLDDHDIVVASRYVPGGGDERRRARVLSSRVLNGFARLVLGPALNDYTSNFVMIRRRVLDEVIPTAHGFGEFFVEFIYRAWRLGFTIHEIPYVLLDRTMGTSKALQNWLGFARLGFRYFKRIIMLRFSDPYS